MHGRGRNRRFWRNLNREEGSKIFGKRGGDSWDQDGWVSQLTCVAGVSTCRHEVRLICFYPGDERAGTGWGLGLVVSGRMTLPRPKIGP